MMGCEPGEGWPASVGVPASPIRPHRAVCFCAQAFLSSAAAGTFVQNHQTTQPLGRAQDPAACPPVGTGRLEAAGRLAERLGRV